MVDFETQVYDKSATDDIVGVEVIVKNDVGEVIETIQVHNKTEFEALVDELNSKLDVLDETYVQFADDSELAGQNLDTILENSNEDAVINALTLNGFSSDRFSKTGHTHTKSDISNMLNYEIAASSYNVNIDSEVTISVTVTDMRDRPVANSPVVIKKNGEAWVNGYTNSQGVFSSVYTASEWGVCRFSVKSFSTQINITGFKLIQSNITYALYVDESSHTAQVRANRTNVTIPAGNGFEYNDFVIPTKYRPSNNRVSMIMRSTQFLNYVFSNGTVGITNLGSTVTNYTINFIHEWHY